MDVLLCLFYNVVFACSSLNFKWNIFQVGKVVQCYRAKLRIYIERIQREKANGATVNVGIHPSKVVLPALNLCSGSVTFLDGGSIHWITDPYPDPALFEHGFQYANKRKL